MGGYKKHSLQQNIYFIVLTYVKKNEETTSIMIQILPITEAVSINGVTMENGIYDSYRYNKKI